jgi:hypothetical protein
MQATASNRFDITEHVDQLVRLGQEDFRSPENERFLMKLGRRITLANGPNAPAAILVCSRDWWHWSCSRTSDICG